jgi:hypothetical protein
LEVRVRRSKNNMMFNVPHRRMSYVLQYPTLDKENIPLQVVITNTTRKPTRVRRGLDAYPKGKWIDQQWEKGHGYCGRRVDIHEENQ